MSAHGEIKKALELVTGGTAAWGSDTCGCDDCAALRNETRLAIMMALAFALKEVSGRLLDDASD